MDPIGKRIVFFVFLVMAGYFAASYSAGTYEPAAAAQEPQRHNGGPFIGTLNGFEFYDPSKGPAPTPRGCTASNVRESTPEELAEAALDFRVDALPATAKEVTYNGLVCDDKIVTVVRSYTLPNNATLDIARIDSDRRLPSIAAKEDLLQVTVGGRKGISNRSLPPVRHEEIYLEDDPGYLYVTGINLSHEDLMKIAASIVNLR